MIKYVILFLFLCAAKVSTAQQSSFDGEIDSPVRINMAEERARQLNMYLDSLNVYDHGALPNFLTNPCFDWISWLWESFHSPVSLRWMVLSNVTNKTVLQKILESTDKRLKLVCSLKKVPGRLALTVPMIEQSTYKLIQKRYRQL